MNVWPLLHRELLVGARKTSTHWLRVGMALASSVIGAMYFFLFQATGAIPVGTIGSVLFNLIAWMAFAITGLFGVFFASDAISSERREGTLGLLFLTRLRGADVVFGKLTSTSLRSFYALMAGLPVIALPILLGGVTFKVFTLAAIVLGNTLFLSVSAGLLISSVSQKPVSAVIRTMVLALSIAGIPILVDAVWNMIMGVSWTPYFSALSPAYSLQLSLTGNSGDFATGIVIQHIAGWLFLVVAAFRTGRFTEKHRQTPKVKARFSSPSLPRPKNDEQLRDSSPIQWLISHGSRGPRLLSLAVVVLMGLGLVIGFFLPSSPGVSPVAIGLGAGHGILKLILLVWFAVEASRQTGDARQSDAFELLLATSLTTKEIVSGFFRGIWRVFKLAVLSLILLQLLAATVTLLSQDLSAAGGGGLDTGELVMFQVVNAVAGVVNLLASCFALIWMGMWMGLRSDHTTAAAAKTFALVIVVPGIVVSFVVGILISVGMAMVGVSFIWLQTIIIGGTTLLIKIGFIVWARRQLLTHFREAANGTLQRRWKPRKVRRHADTQQATPSIPA